MTDIDKMAQKIAKGLREGYVRDLQKPEFDHFERAAIISQVLEDKGWSIREMGRQLNIPKSTIEDWLLFSRMDENEYDSLIEQGVTHTEIYRELRKRKSSKAAKIEIEPVDAFLTEAVRKVKQHQKELSYSEHTKNNITDLRKELDRLESKINIKEKKENGKST